MPALALSGQDPAGTSTDRDPLGGLFPFTSSASDTLTRAIAEGRGNAITRAVESASPAVVNITVTELVQSRRSLIDEEFFRFFMNGYDIPREYTSIGSGFIISPDGLVVTNQHVVGNSPKSVTVTLTSGDSYEAEVIGTDELTDLALLRIRGDSARATFPHLRFSDSDRVQVGEWAIALGNPFGLFEDGQPTVTVGVVSARNRDFRPDPSNPRVYMDMIQTDAAINRGNSGGPLLNSEGSVIGINTFIYTGGTGSGFVGLGFAIPSTRIRMIISQLLSDGEIRLGFDLGMTTTSMTEQLVYRYRLPMIQGLLVTEVNRDGPAFQAGILPGDIILQYSDERVVSQLHANALLRQYAAGDTLRIELLRNGLRYEAQVLLRDKVMAGQ
jgi:serine protease Do